MLNSILDLLCAATRPNYSKYHTAAARHCCHLHQTLDGWVATDMQRHVVAEGLEIWDVVSVLNTLSAAEAEYLTR